MGYKQREKRRKAKAAQDRAQAVGRRDGRSGSSWWLTIVKLDTCCARCARTLRTGREMVYRHEPREALCVPCADSKRVPYKLVSGDAARAGELRASAPAAATRPGTVVLP
jgi:hypothetical protein